MKLPARYPAPQEIHEAMLIVETGLPPEVLDRLPERLIDNILIYKNVKQVSEFGGTYNP